VTSHSDWTTSEVSERTQQRATGRVLEGTARSAPATRAAGCAGRLSKREVSLTMLKLLHRAGRALNGHRADDDLSGAGRRLRLTIAQNPKVVPPGDGDARSRRQCNVGRNRFADLEQQVNGAQDMMLMSSKSGTRQLQLTVTCEIAQRQEHDAIEVQNRWTIAAAARSGE